MSKITAIVQSELDKVKNKLPERAVRVSNVLRDSVFHVMVGGGVSAPGEPPGVRTGNYRNSFISNTENGVGTYVSKITSDVLYGPYLEEGTSKMEARPHSERILDDALPHAIDIYSEPYN